MTRCRAGGRLAPNARDADLLARGPERYPGRALVFRDDMEAARQRVELLERELEQLLPDAHEDRPPLAVEVLELRRRLAAAESALAEARSTNARLETQAQAAAGRAAKLAALEESLERVQAELQRRRRVDEGLWRRAAQADLRGREADHLREELKEARRTAEAEARRADVAEVALIRTQMRLAVELSRPRVDDPWPRTAIVSAQQALRAAYAPAALEALTWSALQDRARRLALLLAELVWHPLPEAPDAARTLIELLQDAGHPLTRRDEVRLGPPSLEDPGLRLAVGPLALQVAVRRADGREVVVTISDEAPLQVALRVPGD